MPLLSYSYNSLVKAVDNFRVSSFEGCLVRRHSPVSLPTVDSQKVGPVCFLIEHECKVLSELGVVEAVASITLVAPGKLGRRKWLCKGRKNRTQVDPICLESFGSVRKHEIIIPNVISTYDLTPIHAM
jgi:hypothetical protein